MLYLKNRVTNGGQESVQRRAARFSEEPVAKRWMVGRWHWIIQFEQAPGEEQMSRLLDAGIEILGYIPDHALLVRAADDQDWGAFTLHHLEKLRAADKVSVALDSADAGTLTFVIEFHPGVDPGAALEIATREGLLLQNSADLLPDHLLVEGTYEQAWETAAWDEVAYLFPASNDLARGLPVDACAGALTVAGPVGYLTARIGDGWDGPGKNPATLTYSFGTLTERLPLSVVQSEIERSMGEWAKYIDVKFNPGSHPSAAGNLHVFFAKGRHDDDYAFDGTGGSLAHAFYPAPTNPEPIAGDLHLDDDENWRVGNTTDLYSVALHELGHTLGLGHSDSPSAVMYAYYRRVTGLADEDIAAIRELYATNTAIPPLPPLPPLPPFLPPPPPLPPLPPVMPPTPPPPPTPPQTPAAPTLPDRTPPALRVSSPAAVSLSTTASTITLRGTATDNIGVSQVVWTSNTAGGGAASGTRQWVVESIPLFKGTNYLVVRAFDAAGNTAWRSIVVTRR